MIFKIAMKHIFSRPALALSTLFAVSCALSIIGIFWTLVENMERVRLSSQQSSSATMGPNSDQALAEITIFVDSSLSENESQKLQTSLRSDARFSSLTVIKSEEALQALQEEFGEALGRALTGDTLPVTYKLQLAQSSLPREQLFSLLNDLRSMNGVLDAEENKGLFSFQKENQGGRIFSWALGLLFLVFAIVALLVSHLIRIAFETLRPEVETLKVLGASKFWIFKPLLIEGIFLGICSAAISLALVAMSIHFLLPQFSDLVLPKGIIFNSLSLEASIRLVLLSLGASIVGAVFTWPLISKPPTQM